MNDHAPRPVGCWRFVLAATLDFLTVFIGGGYLIAKATGNTTDTGFSLSGLPALVMFALIIVYFVVGRRTGGTLWQRILRFPPSPRA